MVLKKTTLQNTKQLHTHLCEPFRPIDPGKLKINTKNKNVQKY